MLTASTVSKQTKKLYNFSVLDAKRKNRQLETELHSEHPIALESRRYIGCKQKLADWIFETATDIFIGTGVVAKRMLRYFE